MRLTASLSTRRGVEIQSLTQPYAPLPRISAKRRRESGSRLKPKPGGSTGLGGKTSAIYSLQYVAAIISHFFGTLALTTNQPLILAGVTVKKDRKLIRQSHGIPRANNQWEVRSDPEFCLVD